MLGKTMFYLCTIIQGAPERTKLTMLEKDSIDELKPYVQKGDKDMCWIEDKDRNVVYGKSKL